MLLQNRSKITVWQFILLMYCATWLVSPFLGRGNIWRILMLGCTSYFAVTCSLDKRNGGSRHFLFTLLMIAYIVMVSLIVKDMYQQRIGTVILLLLTFLGYFLVNYDIPLSYVKTGIEYMFGVCILSNIITLRQLALTPNICRLFAKNVNLETLGYHVMRGTGGYGFIYTILLMLPFALELALFERNDKILRSIAIVFALTSYMLIFKAAYFLALLLSVATLFLYLLFKFPNKLKKDRILFFFIFIILSFVFFDYIVDWVIQFIPIRSIQEKMLSLQSLLNGTEELQDSEFTTRSERYTRALMNTLISPVFGWFTYRRTGNHSHLLDFSAQYGLPLLYGYIQLILNPLRKMNIFRHPAAMTCMIVLGILSLLNSLAFAWGAVLFIFMPMYCVMLGKRQEETMPR